MERAASLVFLTFLLQGDTTIDHIDDIDTTQKVINELLWNVTRHSRSVSGQGKGRQSSA
jgi:hypothetical protein